MEWFDVCTAGEFQTYEPNQIARCLRNRFGADSMFLRRFILAAERLGYEV